MDLLILNNTKYSYFPFVCFSDNVNSIYSIRFWGLKQ
jgi:hypothetical protein